MESSAGSSAAETAAKNGKPCEGCQEAAERAERNAGARLDEIEQEVREIGSQAGAALLFAGAALALALMVYLRARAG